MRLSALASVVATSRPASLSARPCVVAEDADHVVDVVLALAKRLAGIEGLFAGDLGPVALEEFGGAREEGGSLAGGTPWPVGLVEGPPGGGDGPGDVDVVGDVHLGHDRRVGRVDDRAAGPRGRGDPLAVDEQAWHGGEHRAEAGRPSRRWPATRSASAPTAPRYDAAHAVTRAQAGPPPRASLAEPGAEARLRRRDHRRRRARARDGLLPREAPRDHERRGPRTRLARRRERRPQHDGDPLELPVGRVGGDLRARAEALGRAVRGARLRPAVQPARCHQPGPQPARRARGHAAGQREPPQRRRRRVARARGRPAPVSDRQRVARRALPDPRCDLPAARRHRQARPHRVGLRAGGGCPRC